MSSTGGSGAESIRKQAGLRYPDAYHLAISQQLMVYKTYLGNAKRYKALMAMDTLIDFCINDFETGVSIYDKSNADKVYDRNDYIAIPEALVNKFRQILYEGITEDIPALYYLSPPKGYSPKDGHVHIRKPVKLILAWGDRPKEWAMMVGGFNYKILQITKDGNPYTDLQPMFSYDDEDIEGVYTYTVPVGFYMEIFDEQWVVIKTICNTIERYVAQELFRRGFEIEEQTDGSYQITAPQEPPAAEKQETEAPAGPDPEPPAEDKDDGADTTDDSESDDSFGTF